MKNYLVIAMREAWVNLIAAKLRSFLALLGILVGTAAVVAMVSGGELASNEALKQFKVLGTDLLAVSLNETSSEEEFKTSRHAVPVSVDDVMALMSQQDTIRDLAPYTQIYNPLQFNGHELPGGTLGVTSHFASVLLLLQINLHDFVWLETNCINI
jgi:putative ABC transport system permease protein